MMQPPLFAYLKDEPSVTALLGTRIAPFGETPQDTPLPYLVWQTITGTPEIYLACPPDIDQTRIQIDIWAATGKDAEAAATAVRDVLESKGYMVSFLTDRDPDTGAFRVSMDFEFWTPRN